MKKIRMVLQKTYESSESDYVMFGDPDGEWYTAADFDRGTWLALGRPEAVTVTIRPGDCT